MILFNFGPRWHADWSRIVSDDDHSRTVGRWLNGRLAGRLFALYLPYFWKRTH